MSTLFGNSEVLELFRLEASNNKSQLGKLVRSIPNVNTSSFIKLLPESDDILRVKLFQAFLDNKNVENNQIASIVTYNEDTFRHDITKRVNKIFSDEDISDDVITLIDEAVKRSAPDTTTLYEIYEINHVGRNVIISSVTFSSIRTDILRSFWFETSGEPYISICLSRNTLILKDCNIKVSY